MNLWLFAAKNLTYRKIRTALTVISIAVAAAVFYSLASFFQGYEQVVKQQYQELGAHLIVTPVGCPYEIATLVQRGGKIPRYLTEDVVEFVKKQPEVKLVAPALIHAIINPDEGRTDLFVGIDEHTLKMRTHWKLARVKSQTLDSLQLEGTQKRPTAKLLKDEDSLLLGYDAALIELRKPGDILYLPELGKSFKVKAILDATGTQDDGLFYIPLKTAQKWFKREGKLTYIQVQLKGEFLEETDELVKRIKQNVPQSDVITYAELRGTLMRLMNSAKGLIFAVVIVVLVISALGLLNTVLMSVHERVREIGVMRATGAGKGHIFYLVWAETFVMAVIGAVLGLLLAMVAGRGILESILKRFFGLSSQVTLIQFDLRLLALTILILLAIGTVAGLIPALRAAKANPIQALRQE